MAIVADLPYGPNTELVERLLADGRVMGPAAIERVAWGWQHYAGLRLAEYEEAAARARRTPSDAGLAEAVAAAESVVREMTEGHASTQSWRYEHEGTAGRTAEDAALHAALALVLREHIDHETYRTLVKPMSEALPWLLPDEPPDPVR